MGLSRGVKGCIGKYLAVELLMKTARPDAMDIGLLVWQFGGDTCLILPILLQMTSQPAAEHTLWIQPDDEAYRQGRRFGADIMVCAGNQKVLVEEMSIDAIMPAHRHGMNYLPQISADKNTNQLRASGLFFICLANGKSQ